jgi:uncharacterized protein (DUF1697 family)
MQRYVAFLRGINLGKRRPPMTQLKALFEELGFEEVATFIASGNVVFSAGSKNPRQLETTIAGHLKKSLGYDVDTFVRSAEEVLAIGGTKTFPEDGKDGVTIHVIFLQQPLSTAEARKLAKIRTSTDQFRVASREFYWLCRTKVLESTVWQSPEMKALKLPTSTMRNITSLRKLIAKHLS